MKRGFCIRAVAATVFDSRTMERVIDPAIADLQAEPFSVARYLAVVKAIVFCIPELAMQWKSAAVFSGLALAAVVAALELRPLVFAWQQHAFDPRMPVYLLPQGLAIAVNIAIMFGILAAFGGRVLSRRAVIAVLGLAMAIAISSFLNVGWLTPAANQEFRVALFGHFSPTGAPFERGFNELTFNEVRHQYAIATFDPKSIDPADLHFLAVSYHGRWAVTLAPIGFTIFALVLAGRRPLMRWAAGLAVSVAYLAYLLYLDVPNLRALDGRWLGGAAWYPLVVLAILVGVIAVAPLLQRSPSRRVTT